VIPVHAWAKREVKAEDQRDLDVMGKKRGNDIDIKTKRI
jgi:hypothetical protein